MSGFIIADSSRGSNVWDWLGLTEAQHLENRAQLKLDNLGRAARDYASHESEWHRVELARAAKLYARAKANVIAHEHKLPRGEYVECEECAGVGCKGGEHGFMSDPCQTCMGDCVVELEK